MSFLTQPITIQSLFGKDRKLGTITLEVVVNETTNDTLTITKQPVQQGAMITDHAYKEPTSLSMQALFSDNLFTRLSTVYSDLLELQRSRVPFDVITPKRIYRSMLIASLGQTTDKHTENILSISMTLQEVIIVKVTTTTVERARQKTPAVTGETQSAGKKSFLRSFTEGIGALISRGGG